MIGPNNFETILVAALLELFDFLTHLFSLVSSFHFLLHLFLRLRFRLRLRLRLRFRLLILNALPI